MIGSPDVLVSKGYGASVLRAVSLSSGARVLVGGESEEDDQEPDPEEDPDHAFGSKHVLYGGHGCLVPARL